MLAQSRKTPHLRCFIAKTKRIPLGSLVEAGTEQPPAKAGGLAITTKVGIRVKDPFSSPF